MYKPCICAGTIAFVHQKCLEATIAEKRNSKCPVCHYKYQFKPKYQPNAPEHLSTTQVISGLVLRATYKWVPLAVRLIFVMIVWMAILPLLTSYIYQGWMHTPYSISSRLGLGSESMSESMTGSMTESATESMPESTSDPTSEPESTLQSGLTFKNISSDIICGMMITATNIISFLSLLSLAEHFRFNWQPRRQRQRDEMEEMMEERLQEHEQQQLELQQQQQQQQQLELQQQQQIHQQLQQQQQQANETLRQYIEDKIERQIEQRQKEEDERKQNGIIGDEIIDLLKNADVNSDLDYEHLKGFLTSEDEEVNSDCGGGSGSGSGSNIHDNSDLFMNLKMDNNANNANNTSMDNTNNCNEINENHNEDDPNTSIERKSIGVMDEGQTIFSDDIKPSEQFQKQQQQDDENDDDNNNLNHDHHINNFMNERNDSFYSLSDVLGPDDDPERLPSFGGTPIRRQRKRETVQKQMLDKMDIDEYDDRIISSNSIINSMNASNDDNANFGSNDIGNGNGNKQDDQDSQNTENQKVAAQHQQELDEDIHVKNELMNNRKPKPKIFVDDDAAQFDRMMRLQEEEEEAEKDDLFGFDREGGGGEGENEDENDPDENDQNPFEPQFEPLDPALANQDQMVC